MNYRQAGTSSTSSYRTRSEAVALPAEDHIEETPGRLLAFVERHEVLVQLIPFFLAVALILLSFFSDNVAEGMQLLSVAGPRS